ncbi:XTH1 [Symbiodinium natans]|uniref:XTH1 protein n=1 Tax=Symbiodinium natans TaxID=878477 RepID=A0A812T509_9DINO|nr:XTH1 [Symbiodinium natans]
MAPALRLAIIALGWQLQGAISCDCSWTNNGANCGSTDGTFCWRACCPNSCDSGGWTVAYSSERCHLSNGVRRISCVAPSMHQCGTRMSASNYLGRGYHSVRIKAAPGPGIVTTYYLSNNGGLYDKTKTHPWVELDFEIMGNMAGPGGQSRIWTNMFTDIAVEHNQWIIVPFDVTANYHEFGFELGDDTIAFKVDGVPYRTVNIQNHGDVRASIWSTSLQEFVSVWGQSSQDPGEGIPEFQNALGLLDSNPNGFPRYAEVIV